MYRLALLLIGTCFAVQSALASDAGADFSLRAADEPAPSARPWDKGASFSYQNTDGQASWLTDAVLKAAYSWDQKFTAKPGQPEFQAGSIRWNVNAGPYLHKLTASQKPQNDRGVSLSLGGHLVPGGSATGAVTDLDFGITVTNGRKLTQGSGTLSSSYFDVGSERQMLSVATYYQPEDSGHSDLVYFFQLGAKGYSDNAYGSQNPQVNGRVNGAMGQVQFSLAPLGLDPKKHQLGALGFAPMISLNAQTQHDTSATGGRNAGNHRLYSATFSFPFVNNNDQEYSGPVPSVDIKRSTGADLLEGRENKGVTSITLSVKY